MAQSSSTRSASPAVGEPTSRNGTHPSRDVTKNTILVQDLSAVELRRTLRAHCLWLVIAGGCATIALVLPSDPWYFVLLRLTLGGLALTTGTIRLMQANGIMAELRTRNSEMSGNRNTEDTQSFTS